MDVGQNDIGTEAALNLVSIFKEKDQMKSVGLMKCKLGVDGAKAVADYVSVSGSLTSLDLERNAIGAEGAKAIADALRVNDSLTEVIVHVGMAQRESHCALPVKKLKGTDPVDSLDPLDPPLRRRHRRRRAHRQSTSLHYRGRLRGKHRIERLSDPLVPGV